MPAWEALRGLLPNLLVSDTATIETTHGVQTSKVLTSVKRNEKKVPGVRIDANIRSDMVCAQRLSQHVIVSCLKHWRCRHGRRGLSMSLRPPPTWNIHGQKSGGELCEILKFWSFLQSKSLDNVCNTQGFIQPPHKEGVIPLKHLLPLTKQC